MDKRKILSVLISILLVICVSMTVTFAANENGQSTQDPGNPAADDSGQDGSEGQQPGDENKDDSGTQDEGQEGKTPGSTDDQGSGTDESVPDNTKKDDSGDKDKDKSDDPKDQVRKAAKSSKISKEDEEKAIEFEGQIEQIEREMATIEAKLKELQDEIEKYEKRAGELKKKFTAKQKAMGERLRTIYKMGSAGFADVVLSSDNVSDMMVNVEMVKRIYSSDTQAIESLKEDYKELEKEAKKLKAAKKEQKALLKEQLKKMEEQNDTIIASAYLFAGGAGSYKGGKLLWPCPSSHSISSRFGYRNCPFHGRELHRGIDIPTYTGAPILAAHGGIVIRSTYSSGYGNYVTISHGGGLVTLYAHNSSLVAKAGQKVKRGQVIAKAGSTGPSTGTHCHFEVQLNGKLANPLDFLK